MAARPFTRSNRRRSTSRAEAVQSRHDMPANAPSTSTMAADSLKPSASIGSSSGSAARTIKLEGPLAHRHQRAQRPCVQRRGVSRSDMGGHQACRREIKRLRRTSPCRTVYRRRVGLAITCRSVRRFSGLNLSRASNAGHTCCGVGKHLRVGHVEAGVRGRG